MKFDIMVFADRIKELRLDRGMTMAQVAKGIGVNNATISKWESGRIYPSVDSLFLIAYFFQVPAGYIIGLEN